ncbi:MAG: hypothetical protein AVDCRST_MAG85-335, partial [uncultured Solirubrobacteraceae bacterium]
GRDQVAPRPHGPARRRRGRTRVRRRGALRRAGRAGGHQRERAGDVPMVAARALPRRGGGVVLPTARALRGAPGAARRRRRLAAEAVASRRGLDPRARRPVGGHAARRPRGEPPVRAGEGAGLRRQSLGLARRLLPAGSGGRASVGRSDLSQRRACRPAVMPPVQADRRRRRAPATRGATARRARPRPGVRAQRGGPQAGQARGRGRRRRARGRALGVERAGGRAGRPAAATATARHGSAGPAPRAGGGARVRSPHGHLRPVHDDQGPRLRRRKRSRHADGRAVGLALRHLREGPVPARRARLRGVLREGLDEAGGPGAPHPL